MASKDSSDITDFIRSKSVVFGTYCPPCEAGAGATGPTGPAGNTILNGIIPPDLVVQVDCF
jgi:hypothetical protein